MGWINDFEQQNLLTLYGRQARYRCNDCRRPIWVHELEVVDPKGGYHKINISPSNSYQNKFSRPKVTYCRDCDAVRRGKRLPDDNPVAQSSTVKPTNVADWVLKQFVENPKKEFNRRKIIKAWPTGKADTKAIRQAIKDLIKQKKVKRVLTVLTYAGGSVVKKVKKKKK